MLHHGGKIRKAALEFNRPVDEWLDLSTGINPLGWKVPAIPAQTWLRLPEDEDELVDAARSYYGSANLLPVAGSQAAIQTLPKLKEQFRVAVLSPTYSEHAHAWGLLDKRQKRSHYASPSKHRVDLVSMRRLEETMELYDVVVVVNPNNPTGKLVKPGRLLEWLERLNISAAALGREKWLVVDEAFMDCTPQFSMLQHVGKSGLIVLRSMGKFFGLAGARVGFVFAWPQLLADLRRTLGPWQIAGPSRLVATQALLDREWQDAAKLQLAEAGGRLRDLLISNSLHPAGGTAIFQFVEIKGSKEIFNHFARQGILVRHFGKPGGVRFGLPGPPEEWRRLEEALKSLQERLA